MSVGELYMHLVASECNALGLWVWPLSARPWISSWTVMFFILRLKKKKNLAIVSEQVVFLNHADWGHGSGAHYTFSTCAQDHWHLLVVLGLTSNASESSLPIAAVTHRRSPQPSERWLVISPAHLANKSALDLSPQGGSQTQDAASSCRVLIAQKHSSHFFQTHYFFCERACVQNNASARLPGWGRQSDLQAPSEDNGKKV